MAIPAGYRLLDVTVPKRPAMADQEAGKNSSLTRAAVPAARNLPRKIVGPFLICPDDDRKYPSRRKWSELQRDDRMAAESASQPISPSKFSLAWQAAPAAKAALRYFARHQQKPMRKMQGPKPRLHIGPTSRTRD